jgi:hypothetical protein
VLPFSSAIQSARSWTFIIIIIIIFITFNKSSSRLKETAGCRNSTIQMNKTEYTNTLTKIKYNKQDTSPTPQVQVKLHHFQ